MDPRGYIAKSTIRILKERTNTKELQEMLQKIFKTLAEGTRKWDYAVNKLYKTSQRTK